MWLHSLTQLVDQRLGMRLSVQGREESLHHAVRVLAQAQGLDTAEAYIRLLAARPERDEEFHSLVRLVTNGHTSFFRDLEQLDGLAAILDARKNNGVVKIWCAGCSTGEEPYTIAMMALEQDVRLELLATDINQDALGVAQDAAYDAWAARRVPEQFGKYFLEREARLVVRGDVRKLVQFKPHNILHVPPRPTGGDSWDIILCRNVFIYFTQENMERVARRFASSVAGDGHLLIGASERFADGRDWRPEVVGKRIVYRPATLAGKANGTPAPRRFERSRSWLTAAPPGPPSPPFGTRVALAPETLSHEAGELESVKTGFDRVWELLEKDEIAAARTTSDELASLHPANLHIQLTCGVLELQAHSFERAVLALGCAVELDQFMPDAYYFLGVAHRKLGNLESARAAFQRALFLKPDFWPAAFMLAGIYGRLGMSDAKTRELNRTKTALGKNAKPFQSFVHPTFYPPPDEVGTVVQMQLALLT